MRYIEKELYKKLTPSKSTQSYLVVYGDSPVDFRFFCFCTSIDSLANRQYSSTEGEQGLISKVALHTVR